jgi:hypothetical protein
LLELKTAEAADVAEGRGTFANTNATPASFIKLGLVLEEAQYVVYYLMNVMTKWNVDDKSSRRLRE